MSEQETSLVTLPEETVFDVFTTDGGIDPYLDRIENHIKSTQLPSADTAKGRKDIKAFAFKITRSKTYLDGVGKELTTKQKEIPTKIDATRKRMREKLEGWAEEIRAPVETWEENEKARQQSHLDQLAKFDIAELASSDATAANLIAMRDKLISIEIGEHLEEYEDEAALAKDAAIKHLNTLIEDREKFEADQAELAALRAEKVKQEVADREADLVAAATERASKDAEAKAEVERQELIKAKEEAEARATAAAQRECKAAQEKAAREADIDHRRKINAAARDALMATGIHEDTATKIITAIASGDVPNVTINY